jgi:hypothetical protein
VPPTTEVMRPQFDTLDVRIKGLDEKFTLLMAEAEKRNGQRFDAQQEAVATAMVAQEKAVLAAMAAAEKAVTKAEVAAEKRFESVNEFRQTLVDQTGTFITRDRFDGIVDRLTAVEKLANAAAARGAGRGDIWGILTAAIAVLVSLATLAVLIMRH